VVDYTRAFTRDDLSHAAAVSIHLAHPTVSGSLIDMSPEAQAFLMANVECRCPAYGKNEPSFAFPCCVGCKSPAGSFFMLRD
jgi:hypothetical protein